jgi:hypothetical protein
VTAAPRPHGRWLLVAAVVLYVATRAVVLFALESESWDTELYASYAASAIDDRRSPYTEPLPFPYPPVALWAIYTPGAIARTPPSLTQYRHGFRLEMAMFDAAAFVLFVLIVRRRRPARAGAAALVYVATTAVLGQLLFERLDIALACWLLAWLYCWIRAIDGPLAWVAAAYAALGIGISFKLIPIIIVPLLVIHELRQRQRMRLVLALASGLATAVGPFAIQLAVSGRGVLAMFATHAERHIQIESIYSTIASVAARFGAPVQVAASDGSVNLVGPVAAMLKPVSMVVLVGMVGGIAAWAWRQRAVLDGERVYRFACLTIGGAVIASHVLSPQYLLWALPILLVLALDLAADTRTLAIVAGVIVGLAAATSWISATYGSQIVPTNLPGPLTATLGHVVLGVRNLAYLGLVVWLARRMAKELSSA